MNSQTKTITIDGIEDRGFKLVIKNGKENYSLWKKEYQKETDSEAYHQFKTGGLTIGSKVEIEYSEKAKTFTGTDGKTVNYTDRSIWRFLTDKTEDFVRVEEAPF